MIKNKNTLLILLFTCFSLGCASKNKVAGPFDPSLKNEKANNLDETIPFLTKPKIRSYVVPDTIEGNKYIKSHRVFILEDPGSWSR